MGEKHGLTVNDDHIHRVPLQCQAWGVTGVHLVSLVSIPGHIHTRPDLLTLLDSKAVP